MDTIGLQRLEGACVCLSALVLFAFMGDGIAWWLAAILFFAPDISFAGYLAGPKFGAVAYNPATSTPSAPSSWRSASAWTHPS